MTFYIEPDKELTDEEKLLAEVINMSQRLPCGFQIGMPLHLERAIEQVETLFTEHRLPLKDELLSELRRWKTHAEHGLTFSEECDVMMERVIRAVGSTRQR